MARENWDWKCLRSPTAAADRRRIVEESGACDELLFCVRHVRCCLIVVSHAHFVDTTTLSGWAVRVSIWSGSHTCTIFIGPHAGARTPASRARREIVSRVRVQVPQSVRSGHTPRFSDVVSHRRPLLNSIDSSRWARVPGTEGQHTRHPHCAGSRRACEVRVPWAWPCRHRGSLASRRDG